MESSRPLRQDAPQFETPDFIANGIFRNSQADVVQGEICRGIGNRLSTDEQDAVVDILYSQEYDFWTAETIASRTGLEFDRVKQFLGQRHGEARQLLQPSSEGTVLYAPADKHRTFREIVSELQYVLSKHWME